VNQTPKDALKELFKSRWHVELDLRNLESMMRLEMLSCKTPLMAAKELWVYLLAHNLIRLLMVQSALMADCLSRELSPKHSLQPADVAPIRCPGYGRMSSDTAASNLPAACC